MNLKQEIIRLLKEDKEITMLVVVIEGRQRIGKSSYGSKAFAQAFGEWTLEEGE